MNLTQLLQRTNSYKEQYPDIADEIQELYDLAYSEIEQGGSQPHECELAINDMDDLIEENYGKQ